MRYKDEIAVGRMERSVVWKDGVGGEWEAVKGGSWSVEVCVGMRNSSRCG